MSDNVCNRGAFDAEMKAGIRYFCLARGQKLIAMCVQVGAGVLEGMGQDDFGVKLS